MLAVGIGVVVVIVGVLWSLAVAAGREDRLRGGDLEQERYLKEMLNKRKG